MAMPIGGKKKGQWTKRRDWIKEKTKGTEAPEENSR